MKIGIITWFAYENYGTKLQAIALYKTVRDFGCDAVLIDFDPDELIEAKEVHGIVKRMRNLVVRAESKLGRIIYAKEHELRHKRMETVIRENCQLSKKIRSVEEYIEVCNSFDVLVFGSDQIWNPNWYHDYYYANYSDICVQRVAYAPSFGVEEIDECLVNIYKVALNRFDSLSVREKNGANIIKSITGRIVPVVLDPTMLMNNDQWDEIMSVKNVEDEYICLYLLTENRNHYKAARSFAKKMKTKLIVICVSGKSVMINEEKVISAGPSEFISLIKSSKCVITDSFHATVFSIIYNKEFYVFERFNQIDKNSQNSRLYQILDNYSLMNRIQQYDCDMIIEQEKIQYEIINSRLAIDRQSSLEYLLSVLNSRER